jgi:hypothetical protein
MPDHEAQGSAGTKQNAAPSSHQPVHLSGHHRATISQILQHPVSHNIEWRAVVSLLQAVAQVEETHNGRLLVTLGDETETFEPPKHKGIDSQQVVDLRRMLKGAGYVN